MAALAAAGLAVMAPTASTQTEAGSQTFAPGEHTFVVPAGVTSLTVEAFGAGGGVGALCDSTCEEPVDPAPGGLGARVVTTIPVSPGETLTMVVGTAGSDTAELDGGDGGPGSGLGGAGGDSGAPPEFHVSGGGGGGGGGTAILRDGTPLVVAGAGGGGGGEGVFSTPGGSGGDSGSAGVNGGDDVTPLGSEGGGGGGAGGGFFGGGGGGAGGDASSSAAAGAGGGGGSSLTAGGALEDGVRQGDGELVISWAAAAPILVQPSFTG